MERGKRSLSLLLACIMALAVLPGTAWAAGTGQAASTVPLSQQTLEEVSRNLGVPENLAVEIEQSDAYYWDAGGRWLIQVDVYYQGEMVAGAAVDAATGEHVRNIYMYTPQKTARPHPKSRKIKNWLGHGEMMQRYLRMGSGPLPMRRSFPLTAGLPSTAGGTGTAGPMK